MNLSKESIKQIGLIVTGILFICVGFLNYNLDVEEESVEVVAREDVNEINLGDVQLVNAEPVIDNTIDNIVSNDGLEDIQENEEVAKDEYNYFEETKIERERMFSEMIETYQKIIDLKETPSDQKAIAVQEISNIANMKNGIMISENLIKNKGFEDVVILINNKAVSVVVKSYTLNKEEISKIQNIIERELEVETKNINISNKF